MLGVYDQHLKMQTLLIKSHKWKLELSFPVKSERLSVKQLKRNNTVYHEKNIQHITYVRFFMLKICSFKSAFKMQPNQQNSRSKRFSGCEKKINTFTESLLCTRCASFWGFLTQSFPLKNAQVARGDNPGTMRRKMQRQWMPFGLRLFLIQRP